MYNRNNRNNKNNKKSNRLVIKPSIKTCIKIILF